MNTPFQLLHIHITTKLNSRELLCATTVLYFMLSKLRKHNEGLSALLKGTFAVDAACVFQANIFTSFSQQSDVKWKKIKIVKNVL